MKYRAEIDGLRAVILVPIIFFHAGFELFSGGFAGVDVFFVISGYLITTILIEDIENKEFSIVNFYERRARRLLPALFLVMLVCIPFAWMWMLPSQMKDFSQSLIAVSFFASNILFWLESGYFTASSEEKPLLHTWSLAVEEQYYLLFPIFLFLAWRFGKNRVFWMIVVMAAISLVLSEWGWRNKAIPNFYLAPARAWELFSGSIAAFVVQRRGVQKNNVLALIGLAAVVFSIFVYDETIPFPSVYAIVPVLGAFLLILYADKETFAAKLLSTKPLVVIGLMSYSAYLWHQPMFAFARIFYGEVTSTLFFSLIIINFFIAYFTWRYIEEPFRNKKNFTRIKIFSASIFLCVAFVGFGLLGHFQQGFWSRISYEESVEAITKEWDFSGYPTHNLIQKAGFDYLSVGKTMPDNSSTIFIGDSHGTQYWYSIANFVEENPDMFYTKNVYLAKIPLLSSLSVENFKLPNNTETVILSYFWAFHLNNPNVNTYIRCCGEGPKGVYGKYYVPISKAELDVKYSNLEDFLIEMKNNEIRVILILDNPFGEEHNAQSLLNIERGFSVRLTGNELSSVELQTPIALERREPTVTRLLEMAKTHNLEVIDPFDYLCDINFCSKFNKDFGYLKYKDYDHLSHSAIKNEGRFINQIFFENTKSSGK